MSDWPERDRLRAANAPPAWTTNRRVVSREDLFHELDILRAKITEKDGMMDSGIRASLTRLGSLAATLIPPSPPSQVCGVGGCRITFRSEDRLREHQAVVHWLVTEGAE